MNIDQVNERYHGDPTDPMTERTRQRIHWICSEATGKDVLDIGCSQGIVCQILGREGFRCTGIDIEAASLAVAQEALAKEDEIVRQRVTFQVGDATQLPFENESFDTVVLGEVLEHFTQPARLLSEAHRVLRDGGRLIVTVPYGLNAFHDHKQTYYPISLLGVLQPLFRTRGIDTLNSYIVYAGAKDATYDPHGLSEGALFDEYVRLEKSLEARCLEKERALLELGTKLYAQIRTLTAQASAQTSKIKELEETGTAKDKQILDLESSLRQTQASAGELREKLTQAEQESTAQVHRIKELDLALAASGSRLRELEGNVEQARASAAVFRDRMTHAEQESATQANTIQRLEATIAASRNQIRELESSVEQTRASAAAFCEKMTLAEREATSQTGRIKQLEETLAANDNQVREREGWLEQTQASIAAFRERTAQAEAEQVRLRAEAANSHAALTEVKQRLSVLETENAGLRQELASQQAARQEEVAQAEAQHKARLREREKHFQNLLGKREANLNRLAANQRIRELVRAALPADAQVLVISHGDDDLLCLDGRHGSHFPQAVGGVYAGYHPKDSAEAIARLETLKAKGAQFLLIPASSLWWLEFYAEFRQHLETDCHLLLYEERSCVIYSLRAPAADQRVKCGISVPASAPHECAPSAAPQSAEFVVSGAPAERRQVAQAKSSEVTLGVILDEFTTGCFRPESRLITFRPDNWPSILERDLPDALFVESAWRGNDGAWLYRVANYNRKLGNELAELLHWAKQRAIPSIFWNKEDPVHFDRFIETARLCSYVFTTDADCLPKYRDQVGHDRVFALPFAAQPAIHNPIQVLPRTGAVCFAGTYYGKRHAERQNDMDYILRPAIPFGLEIYDRQHGVTGKGADDYRFPDIYQPSIKGRLDYDEMVKAYKRYRVFLNVNSVKQSPTMFSRRVFELLACGTPVISTYSLGIVELLGEDVVFFTESEADTRRHIERLLGDDDAWAQASVRGIRKVMREHTYQHRLREVFERVGITLPEPREPRISAIVRIDSEAQLECLVPLLAAQTYRRFDVVLISDAPLASPALNSLRNALPDVSIVNVVGPAGKVLSQCLKASSAEYVAILNLRHSYGPDYLLDHALAVMYSGGAEFVGKHTFCEAAAHGQQQLRQSGHEFQYVTSVPSGSLVVKKTAFSQDLFQRALNNGTFAAADRPILSIDRFNYLQDLFADQPLSKRRNDELTVSRVEVSA